MDLKLLFYPRNIAVVGASPRIAGGKLPFYQALLAAGYEGKLYPVNPAHKEIGGAKVYPSLDSIPNDADLAIVSVPASLTLPTIEAAVKKGIKFMHFFTSGFSEVGNRELEEAAINIARSGNLRIVGPNCIGIHCNESKVTFDPTLRQEGRGNVGFLGQSGGVTNDFTRMAVARKIALNKAVSYGNQIDLRAEDYIEYFADDDAIRTIAAYIEDVKDGRRFIEVIKRAAKKKPVVILKGGVTEHGARAAFSHTGALAMHPQIWSAVMRQCGCIEARSIEQLINIVMLATSDKIPAGPRAAFLTAGGGVSVLFTDLAISYGLTMPRLEEKTQKMIAEKIPAVNTSTANPVDMGAFGLDFAIMAHAMLAADTDENIDMLVVYLPLDFMSMYPKEKIIGGLKEIARIGKTGLKPSIFIISGSTDNSMLVEEIRITISSILREAGLPVYKNIQDAVQAISAIIHWT